MRFELTTETKNEVDCLLTSRILFQEFTPEYVINFRPSCKIFSRVIEISPLEACLVSY